MLLLIACAPGPADSKQADTAPEETADTAIVETADTAPIDTHPTPTADLEITLDVAALIDTPMGCTTDGTITIANVGDADLRYELSAESSSSELRLNYAEGTLAPGAADTAMIHYSPSDLTPDTLSVHILSDDPAELSTDLTVDASAVSTAGSDTFTAVVEATDLLWVVDNSRSMGEEITALGGAAEAYAAGLIDTGIDVHLGVITTQDAAMQGAFLDTSTPDLADTFAAQVGLELGPDGDEMGSEMARTCLDGGECATSGFLRADAGLQIIYVTDETDSSGMESGWDWSQYVSAFEDLKSAPDLVRIHAIAGDYPGGCATAYAGEGYYEQVLATGGLYFSVCERDWTPYVDALVDEAIHGGHGYTLTQSPIEDTLAVTVDGVTNTDWTYDAATTSIAFTDGPAPAAGSTIEVSYTIDACP